MYLLEKLKKLCCVRLYKHFLNIETCGYIFEKSIMAEETGLKLLCLDYMFKNYGAVLKHQVVASMNPNTRQEFLDAVPDNAVLDICHHHRFISSNSHQAKLNTNQSIITKPTLSSLSSHHYHNYTPASTLYTFDITSSSSSTTTSNNNNSTTTTNNNNDNNIAVI
jgi:hypothetical protein